MSHSNEVKHQQQQQQQQNEDANSIAPTGSVASSNASQTRFSFYNAEEFRVMTTTTTTNESQKQRFHFYDPHEIRFTQTVVETIQNTDESSHLQVDTSNNNGDDHPDQGGLDSDDILKSLQEHEQQRLEILSGPRSLQQQPQPQQHTTTTTTTSTNPYEDAIQEALELLRKHRSHASLNSSLDVDPGDTTEEHDPVLLLRPRSAPNAASHPNRSSFADTEDTNYIDNNQNDNRHLGLAYQAEIQARRKQRQERMAKYATRLAELKQQNNNHNQSSSSSSSSPPDVKTTRSLDSPPSSTYLRNPNFRNEPQPFYDHILANRSDSSTAAPQEIVPSLTGECSVSTLSNHDDVQRGVERVLLAILERANHSNTNSRSSNSNSGNHPNANNNNNDEEKKSTSSMASQENPPQQQQQQQQQYHSSSQTATANSSRQSLQNHNEDALLRAVTEILGPTISPPVIMSTTTDEQDHHHNEDEEDAISFATQDEPPPVDSSDSGGLLNIPQPDNDDENDGVMKVVETHLENHVPPIGETHKPSDFLRHHRIIITTSGSSSNDKKSTHEINHNPNALSIHHRQTLPLHPEEVDPISHATETASSPAMNSAASKTQTGRPFNSGTYKRNSHNSDNLSVSDSDDHDSDDDDSENENGDEKNTTNEQSSIMSSSVDSCEDESCDDDESSDKYHACSKDKRKYNSALGPLNKKSGGRTGVVLEHSENSLSSSYEDDNSEENGKSSPIVNGGSSSILESLTAAVSLVTGGRTATKLEPKQAISKKDRYISASSSEEDDESDDEDAIEANDLMRSLCAHLLPVGVDSRPGSRILDKIPDWDDTNPDEPGYRIIRLNSYQLRCVERAYDKMIDNLHRKSRRKLGGRFDPDESTDETAFERDLRAAEDLLDEEEERLKASGATSVPAVEEASSIGHSSVVLENGDEAHEVTIQAVGKTNSDELEFLPDFPGVKPAGRGEMGDLEYFTLPIIFKSHVTGFEPTKDMVLEPGNVVAGQYLVEGVLGSAAFSTAYKCIDLNSDEDSTGVQEEVCLKVIKNTKDFFDQSLDEIKILELLRQTGKCHENYIIEMKTFFYHREHLIIVTELLRQNLFEFGKFIIDSGEEPYFTIDRMSYITRQCLIALKFVHSIGLVHSDVKPENILLSSYSRAQIKLIDFGSSCYLTDRQSSYIQSRSYRAPEVILGLPYDGRIDIWSIGCVVAEMFTGEVTFQNDSVVSMLSRIEAICGPFPRHMITQGRQSSRFFTKCGLLYEKVEDDDDGRSHDESRSDDDSHLRHNTRPTHIDIFQPKRTTLSARLGFEPNLMEKYDSGKSLTKEEMKRGMFVDLIRKLLTIDPEARPTAAEALQHPMMQYASTLKEENIKYPSK
jgi:serine/threonine protein kinase